ncbi:hypothetical protein ACWPKO_08470 [Coraliomargarita sp. W4R53]
MSKTVSIVRVPWWSVGLIAATYVFFLIFAQFGFLHRVRESLGQEYWNLVLGVMGLAGCAGALFAVLRYRNGEGRRWLLFSFIGAAAGACLAALGAQVFAFVLSAFISGFFLSTLTVSLIAILAEVLPVRGVGLVCGLGTGAAYFISNVPVVFEASPQVQCLVAALACLFGCIFVLWMPQPVLDATAEALSSQERRALAVDSQAQGFTMLAWVIIFTVLVWSDSAAFTRIQETPELKAASWSGDAQLWSLGLVHFTAAVLAGYLLDTGRLKTLFMLAFAGLFLGWLGLEQGIAGVVPAWFYASGVSLYSTALVGFVMVRGVAFRPVLLAGVVFGISGWIGSAMGIGMVNDLGRVPMLFWAVAAAFLLLGLRLMQREAAV